MPSTAAGGPEQFWLALGAAPDSVVVSWLTATADDSTVKFGTGGSLSQTATGTSSTYTTIGYTSGHIHIVTLAGLTLGASYSYQVGGATAGFSATMTFTAPTGVGAVYPFKLAAIGDLGQTANSNSTIFHVIGSDSDVAFITGDLSYADGDQPRWDSFQRLIAPLSSSTPVMVCPGSASRARTRTRRACASRP